MSSKNVVIFDLDGTISDPSHRLHFVKSKQKDFDSFYAGVAEDKPKWDVINLLLKLKYDSLMEIWIVSGRSDLVRKETEEWLRSYGIVDVPLIMRKHGDYTHDATLKRQWLLDGTIPNKERILFCVDDRQRVVDMWRSEGLTCMQVDQWEEIDWGKTPEGVPFEEEEVK